MSIKSVMLPVAGLLSMALVKYLNVNNNINLVNNNINSDDNNHKNVIGNINQKTVTIGNNNQNNVRGNYSKKNVIGRQEGFDGCAKLVNVDILSCCTLMDFQWPSAEYMKAIDECTTKDISQCQPDACIAAKWNLLSDENGKETTAMNRTAMEDFILDRWPDTYSSYVMTCIVGSVEYYDDTPDLSLCELIRTRRCLISQTIITGCGGYDTSTNPDLCSDIQKLADHCSTVFPSQYMG